MLESEWVELQGKVQAANQRLVLCKKMHEMNSAIRYVDHHRITRAQYQASFYPNFSRMTDAQKQGVYSKYEGIQQKIREFDASADEFWRVKRETYETLQAIVHDLNTVVSQEAKIPQGYWSVAAEILLMIEEGRAISVTEAIKVLERYVAQAEELESIEQAAARADRLADRAYALRMAAEEKERMASNVELEALIASLQTT